MKWLAVSILAMIAFLAGCKPDDSTQPQVDAGGTNAVVASTKDQIIADMRSKLDALNAEMNELGTRLQAGSEKVKAEAQPKLDALREKAASLRAELTNASSSVTWDDFKTDFEKSSTDLKESVTQARQWLSEKIAPSPSTN